MNELKNFQVEELEQRLEMCHWVADAKAAAKELGDAIENCDDRMTVAFPHKEEVSISIQ